METCDLGIRYQGLGLWLGTVPGPRLGLGQGVGNPNPGPDS